MKLDLEHLEALAKKASAGGWRMRSAPRLPSFVEAPKVAGMAYALEVLGDDYTGYGDEEQRANDVAFIAAANPITVLALIAELRAAQNNKEQK